MSASTEARLLFDQFKTKVGAYNSKTSHKSAKECALFCVMEKEEAELELINSMHMVIGWDAVNAKSRARKKHYKEVKEEIRKF